MRKILGIAAAVIAVPVVAVLGLAATKPDTFRIERSVSVQAPPEKVYALVEDFHAWQSWSPFEKLDPAMKRTFSGAERGKGAVYGWDGNDHAGAGRMEIVEAATPNKVTIKLDFTKPMESSNTAEFTMEPQGGETKVTWAMHGPQQFIGKVMCVFVSMDAMVGKEFETGLASLKTLAEKAAATPDTTVADR